MTYIKDPNKFVQQRFKERGAVPAHKDARGTMWRFPDGRHVHVPRQVSMTAAAGFVRDIAPDHAVTNRQAFAGGKVRGPKPRLDLEKLTASAHAKERLALMQSQVALTFADVLYALRCPERVLWSDVHESWVWVGSKVALPLSFDSRGHAIIRTVLWSQQELWAIAPRPKENR